MLAYWASYIAYDAAHLDLETYSPNAAANNPALADIANVEQLALLFRRCEANTTKAIGKAATEAGALAVEASAEAFRLAAQAVSHAVSNLRAAKLLDSGDW